ncbi:hypothetical protein D3C86_2225150 [compost metagenome]
MFDAAHPPLMTMADLPSKKSCIIWLSSMPLKPGWKAFIVPNDCNSSKARINSGSVKAAPS